MTAVDSLNRTIRVTLPDIEKTVEHIGRYKLLQLIGEGGMGGVWMAEQKGPVRRHVAGLFQACCLSVLLSPLAGCVSTQPKEEMDPKAYTFWKPHLLYLQRAPHPSLYVEVDAVQGTGPSDAVLDQLKQFLSDYCDKPEGIQIVRSDIIPRSQAVGYSHEALACRYLNGPPDTSSNLSPAFIYVLYYDSRVSADPTARAKGPIHKHQSLDAEFRYTRPNNPQAQIFPFPGSIFMDKRYLAKWPRSLEGLLLMHEAGHVLGLTQNDAHGTNLHCLTETCLMRPTLKVDFPKMLYSSQKTRQTNLCAECRADLEANRQMAVKTNIYFLGPMLVRSEESYHVISLPSELKLFIGELANFDPKRFRKEVQDDGTKIKGRFPDARYRGEMSFLNPDTLNTELERAKADKSKQVYEAAEKLTPVLQRKLGYRFLTGNGVATNTIEAVKWFGRAAGNGDAESQLYLGWCYSNGKGVIQDHAEALNWYRQAAERGLAYAQNALGYCYEHGFGTEKSTAVASGWYRKAAEQGNVEAMTSLARLLSTSPDADSRDASTALAFASKAVAVTNRKDAGALNALAAAYAESGDFAKAVSVQTEAIALLQDEKSKKDFVSRLKLYESNTPYRER